jgi:hypothetical protein
MAAGSFVSLPNSSVIDTTKQVAKAGGYVLWVPEGIHSKCLTVLCG